MNVKHTKNKHKTRIWQAVEIGKQLRVLAACEGVQERPESTIDARDGGVAVTRGDEATHRACCSQMRQKSG